MYPPFAAFKDACLATNRLTHARCIHAEAATALRERSVEMPFNDGKNCGLKPPALKPASRLPGIIRLSVSGDQDATSSIKYATQGGASDAGDAVNRAHRAKRLGWRAPR